MRIATIKFVNDESNSTKRTRFEEIRGAEIDVVWTHTHIVFNCKCIDARSRKVTRKIHAYIASDIAYVKVEDD
jgi:hypothetical protein